MAEEKSEKSGNDKSATKPRRFYPTRNRVLKWAVGVLPFGVVAFILIDVLFTQQYVIQNPMFATGLLAAGLDAFLLHSLFEQVPEALDSIWARKLLQPRKRDKQLPKPKEQPEQENRKRSIPRTLLKLAPESCLRLRATPIDEGNIEEYFETFMECFEGTLNHPSSWLLGLFFAAVMYLSFPFRMDEGWTFNWMRRMLEVAGWLPLLGSLTQVAIAYVLGLLAWRMIVIAWTVSRLGQLFDLDIQVQHPDKSGGLKPLGDLCFSNALVISIPAFYLAGWIVAIRYLELEVYGFWTPFFQRLLLVIVVLAFLAFFRPLYAVHRAMVRQRGHLRRSLDELSVDIDKLAQQLLNEAKKLKPEEGEELTKKLALLRQVYQSNSKVPVWPFDTSIALKFITSQAVPLLSLTGIGPSILKLIKDILSLIQPG